METGSGHYVYNYRYAVTIDGSDYYLYREYYEDGAGNSAATGTNYVVDIMDGTCYKAVQTAQTAARAAEADGGQDASRQGETERHAGAEQTEGQAVQSQAAADPWSSLTLQALGAQDRTSDG